MLCAVAFQPMPESRSLRRQLEHALENPLRIVKGLWTKQVDPNPPPITMAAYTEAADKFTTAAAEIMEHAHRLAEARNAYQRWQKETELVRLRKEVAALRLVIPLLVDERDTCQIEYGSSGKADGMPCRKAALARCADCGVSICSGCRQECCGDSFCDQCYRYHRIQSCLKRPAQNERDLSAGKVLSPGAQAG